MSDLNSVSVDNPIRVYPDGLAWCALWGENIQEGVCGFGDSPEGALAEMMRGLSRSSNG